MEAFKSGAFNDVSIEKEDDIKNEAGKIISYGEPKTISVEVPTPPADTYYIFAHGSFI